MFDENYITLEEYNIIRKGKLIQEKDKLFVVESANRFYYTYSNSWQLRRLDKNRNGGLEHVTKTHKQVFLEVMQSHSQVEVALQEGLGDRYEEIFKSD